MVISQHTHIWGLYDKGKLDKLTALVWVPIQPTKIRFILSVWSHIILTYPNYIRDFYCLGGGGIVFFAKEIYECIY
jgi:hypothetical protein